MLILRVRSINNRDGIKGSVGVCHRQQRDLSNGLHQSTSNRVRLATVRSYLLHRLVASQSTRMRAHLDVRCVLPFEAAVGLDSTDSSDSP